MATMTDTRTRELLDVEHRFWTAMQEKDAGTASAMTDDGCIIVGAQGVSAIDAKSMARMTAEGAWELEQYSFDEQKLQVRFLTDEIAIVAYPVKEDLVVGGKPLSLSANDSSVWVRRGGEWRCALHTESLAGDPYGRDRTTAPRE
jgi:hypothetical protein